jgi:RimJ/RimL family protein N-acetyltransferase
LRVTLRPSVASDFVALIDRAPAYRCQCLTAEADGKVIGVGGFLFPPGGDVWASVFMLEEAKRYRVAIHRAGLMAMALAKKRGFQRIYATAQPDNPAAERWLERLGFEAREIAGEKVYVWQCANTTTSTPDSGTSGSAMPTSIPRGAY